MYRSKATNKLGFTAVILAAGRGSRMGDHTDDVPKCLIEVLPNVTILGLQLDQLKRCEAVTRIVVVAGYQIERVEQFLAQRGDTQVEVLFNPFFDVSNNLHSLWLAQRELEGGGLIINGDDLFHPELISRVLPASADIAVTISRKDSYDDDDMKVQLNGDLLTRIGKDIPLSEAEGEAIGIIRLSACGAAQLATAVERIVRTGNRSSFYLLAVQALIDGGTPVAVQDISPLPWAEVDEPSDLAAVRDCVSDFLSPTSDRARSIA